MFLILFSNQRGLFFGWGTLSPFPFSKHRGWSPRG